VKKKSDARLDALLACLEEFSGRYKSLRGAADVAAYLGTKGDRADEEILVEPVLAMILERVLGFPTGGYFPQLGKGGLKPDFTPTDLIAHPFVLDAKSSDQNLAAHEPQIRRYIVQRALDYGVLFNLGEFRVYRRVGKGHDPELSFSVLRLWEVARGEALPSDDVEAFERFCDRFSYREMGTAEKVDWIRRQQPWPIRLAGDEQVEVDVEFLVQRLRDLSVELSQDAAAEVERLDAFVKLNPDRERKVLGELRQLALDVEPGADLKQLPTNLRGWRSSDEGLPARVWRQYLLRVAYLALARILLYRAWEDVEFVDQFLYDGGFDDAYARMSEDARRVLDEAFLHGAERYRWLFGVDNNYEWYRPREPALVDVLYSLAPVPLGKLDADVLGALYVSYVDEIDRDRLGQFFTPRPVVRFMLDRVGFRGPEGVFRIEGDERKPLRVLDFATGSGGFLVEAARRIIDDGGYDDDDPRELEEALAAIVRGFVGGEISPFPYYLTEINLLLQVSRLLGRLRVAGQTPPGFVLGPLHVDTLTAKSTAAASLDVEPGLRADRAELIGDEAYDLVPLDGPKLETFRRLREDEGFDLVVGNPPYVTEANNKPLFDRLRAIDAWRGIYRGKTDYLYYFLWLAVEKLASGGRLCVITPAGWMNAGAADFLREKLAASLRIDELFLFGSYRLFADEQGPAPTPTVESLILVATKAPAPDGHSVRVVALEDESAAPAGREELLAEMVIRAAGKPGRSAGIHAHDVPQAELRAERPWPVKFGAGDVASRVVAHLQGLLDDDTAPVEVLSKGWHVFQGIQSGADAYTARIQRRLPAAIRQALAASGAKTGEPILELPPGMEAEPPWRDHSGILARSPESRAVLYAAVDDENYASIVWLGRQDEAPESVITALERWKPVLATRAEIARNPKRRWWETAWPRNKELLGRPKVIALYRTDRGRFALDEAGEWQPSIKLTLAVGKDKEAPVAYLCGLLNSELLDLWYAVRGKTPWHVRRNYEPKRMNEIPYRRPDGDPRADQIAGLVREIAANRRALLPHRAVVRDLGRTVKDPWRTGPVEIDRAALIQGLPAKRTVSLRLDPELEATLGQAPLGRPHREAPDLLLFRRARAETGRITGDPRRLDVVEELIGGRSPDDLAAVLLPCDLGELERLATERKTVVEELLAEGRRLVEEVERLVCALYDVPDGLTDEVVAHAVARAGSSDPVEDE
jgi:hypothetical protein